MESIGASIVGLVFAFIIGVLITRWIFSIDKMLHNQVVSYDLLLKQNKYLFAQTELLTLIAEKQGVTKSDIDKVITKFNS